MPDSLILLIFFSGWFYGRLALLVVELLEQTPALRHWWHGLFFPLRGLMMLAWPLTAMWIWRNGHAS